MLWFLFRLTCQKHIRVIANFLSINFSPPHFKLFAGLEQQTQACLCYLLSANTLCHLAFNLLLLCIHILSHRISVNRPYLLAAQINWLTSIGHFRWMRGSWALTWSKRERCFASSAMTRRSCSRRRTALTSFWSKRLGERPGEKWQQHRAPAGHTHTRW